MLTNDDIGKIFYYKDSPTNRKRIVEIANNKVYTIEMEGSPMSIPVEMSSSILEEALNNDEIVWVKEEHDNLPDLNKTQEELGRKRWESIGLKWRDPETKRKLLNRSERVEVIQKIGQELNIKERQTRTLLTRFWRGGMTRSSLFPQRKGPTKGIGIKNGRKARDGKGVVITRETEALFEEAYQKYHLRQGKSIDKTYTNLLRDHYCIRTDNNGVISFDYKSEEKTPTINQFRYWVKNYQNRENELRSRYGDKEFENSFSILQGSTLDSVKGVGVRAELDATHLPIELVSERDRCVVVGTPLLELLVDVYSRMVMGFHLTLENESYMTGALTILNALENKKKYAQTQGVEISEEDWPSHHVPHIILSDNGPFCSRYTDLMEEKFHCYVENATARKGSAKGNVERKNRTFEDYISDSLPGTAKVVQKGRGAKDPADEACLTLSELRQLIIRKIVEFNHTIIEKYPLTPDQINTGIVATPLQLWKYSTDQATDELLYIKDLDMARIILLPQLKDGRIMHRDGIRAFNLVYTSQEPAVHNWMLNHVKDRVKVAYDPQDISHIYVVDDDRIITLDLNPAYQNYRGMSLKELEYYKKQNLLNQQKSSKESRLKKVATVDFEEEIIKRARRESRKYKNKKDKKGNRREEIIYQREKTTQAPPSEPDEPAVKNKDNRDQLRSALYQKKIDEVLSERRGKNE